ncbi:MAG: tripartite tricarboxylate transporter substrate binding protein [Burkholderiales bacterium]|nr:tripartite tricarboxylate transporter substrate binding protein [Burkholderiales bacterium]
MRHMFKLAAVAVFAATVLGSVANVAAQQYPNKPIRMVVPFPPGGGNDAIGRLVAQKMSEGLGQQIVVDNRPGAGTTLGTGLVAKSPADGYTILLSSVTSLALAPNIYEKPGYDPLKDFAGISLLATTPYILTVGVTQPYRSVQDIIKAAKAKPGALTFASGGIGSNTHLSGAIFEELTGTNMLHVPYKGSGPAFIDLVSNRVTMMFDTATAATQHILSGKLRALAVTGNRRLPDLPNVPTFAEAGVQNFGASSWYSIHVPAGTPALIVAKLNAEVNRVVNLPEVRSKLLAISAEPVPGTPENLDAFVKAEFSQWGQLIKKLGVKAE